MRFDDDLKWARLAARGLLAVNLVLAAAFGYGRQWSNTLATLIWAGNCVVWLRTVYACQVTRDEIRIVEAAINGVHKAER